jgi:hypothetical protein
MGIMKQELHQDLLIATVSDLKSTLMTIAMARFKEDPLDGSSTIFVRNVLLNLICNVVVELTNYQVKGSLKLNVEGLKEDIDKWFAKLNEQKKDAH